MYLLTNVSSFLNPLLSPVSLCHESHSFSQSYLEILRERLLVTTFHLYTPYVVATTCQNGTHDMLTSAKLSVGYLVVGITRELNKEPLMHCYLIYINTEWSMLQQCPASIPALKGLYLSYVYLQ